MSALESLSLEIETLIIALLAACHSYTLNEDFESICTLLIYGWVVLKIEAALGPSDGSLEFFFFIFYCSSVDLKLFLI